jgi:hypothetical protein
MNPELIYCADGNARFADLAINRKDENGLNLPSFTYGARLPNTVYFKPQFVDQNWRNPNLDRYVEAVEKYKPRLATVLDWERWDQLGEVIQWGYAIAPYVQEAIIIIPKVRFAQAGWQDYIPRSIRGVKVRLGYSVSTKFSGTTVPKTNFLEWDIHLLGGSPMEQAKLAGLHLNGKRLLVDAPRLNIVSVDGNYHLKMATKYNQFFIPDGSARYAKNRFWPSLKEADGKKWGDGSNKADAPYEAFRRSCEAIMDMWR